MPVEDDLDSRLRAIGATVRDEVLELPARDGHPARQLRVCEGVVFLRHSTGTTWREREWRSAKPDQVFGYFVDDSAVATWLRTRGANVLKLALASLGR
ncbi:MAG: hypothetical protein ACK53A_02460 [Gemmatimonadota bacterium]|jgi:hypothetical protein|nr:hypothetical protein [Gemmatimonadota bacterium]